MFKNCLGCIFEWLYWERCMIWWIAIPFCSLGSWCCLNFMPLNYSVTSFNVVCLPPCFKSYTLTVILPSELTLLFPETLLSNMTRPALYFFLLLKNTEPSLKKEGLWAADDNDNVRTSICSRIMYTQLNGKFVSTVKKFPSNSLW